MTQKIKTFLLFDGRCEEAMTFYVSLFRDAAVTNIRRYGPGEQGPEGSVMKAGFAVQGQTFMCVAVKRGFTFTPAMSDRFGVSWQLNWPNDWIRKVGDGAVRAAPTARSRQECYTTIAIAGGFQVPLPGGKIDGSSVFGQYNRITR